MMSTDDLKSKKSMSCSSQNTSQVPEEANSTSMCGRIFDTLRSRNSKRHYAHFLLALVLVACSLWQCQEVLVKYIEGSTTTTVEKEHNDHLSLPKVALCMKERYNYKALATMGLPNDYFSENRHRTQFDTMDKILDLNQTWLNATWSREDIQMAAATGATHTAASFSKNIKGIIFSYSSTTRGYLYLFLHIPILIGSYITHLKIRPTI